MNRFSLEHDGHLLEVETERAGMAKDVARLFIDGQQATERTAQFGGPTYLEHGATGIRASAAIASQTRSLRPDPPELPSQVPGRGGTGQRDRLRRPPGRGGT